ncbi:hypothetical protein ACIPOR_15640 [Photobacterium damselae subsp. piscicida]|uniref:hypothetical protein n=1 Tax=Photobacterium damselae TaxID=38293 RepID=UPI00143278C6|nr:hypothetical protein [Photobacterium damselae]
MEKRMLILSLLGKMDEYFYQETEKIKLTNSNQIDRVLTKRYTPSIEQSISLRIKE